MQWLTLHEPFGPVKKDTLLGLSSRLLTQWANSLGPGLRNCLMNSIEGGGVHSECLLCSCRSFRANIGLRKESLALIWWLSDGVGTLHIQFIDPAKADQLAVRREERDAMSSFSLPSHPLWDGSKSSYYVRNNDKSKIEIDVATGWALSLPQVGPNPSIWSSLASIWMRFIEVTW